MFCIDRTLQYPAVNRPQTKPPDNKTTRSVGIVTALVAESGSLSRAKPEPAVVVRVSPQALLYVSGVGSARASEAAEKLLADGAEGLVSWGVAGGLDPGLVPGTLMLPGSVVDEHGSRYECDPVWRQQLEQCLAGKLALCAGDLLQAEQVIGTRSGKVSAFQITGARGVDMESATLADVASRAGKPFVAIRAIVDPASQTLPPSAYRAVRANGSSNRLGLLASLARRPQDLSALIKLAFCFRAAHRTLAAVIATAGTGLLFHTR